MTSTQVRIGGSFAPPIDDSQLDKYEELASFAAPQVEDYMRQLIKMLRKFRETPSSSAPGVKHPLVNALVVPLEQSEIDRIWDDVPWPQELNVMGQVFETVDSASHRDLRNAAFHLLWFGRELCADREPITKDKIQA